jgi:hypothetical protein
MSPTLALQHSQVHTDNQLPIVSSTRTRLNLEDVNAGELFSRIDWTVQEDPKFENFGPSDIKRWAIPGPLFVSENSFDARLQPLLKMGHV